MIFKLPQNKSTKIRLIILLILMTILFFLEFFRSSINFKSAEKLNEQVNNSNIARLPRAVPPAQYAEKMGEIRWHKYKKKSKRSKKTKSATPAEAATSSEEPVEYSRLQNDNSGMNESNGSEESTVSSTTPNGVSSTTTSAEDEVGPFAAPTSIPTPSKVEITILYGTDRERGNTDEIYGNKSKEKLSFGICKVSIPPHHKRGEIEEKIWWRLQFTDNPERDIVLTKVTPLNKDQFSELLNTKSDNDTFLFVHGFNTTFKDAALQTAQIAYDVLLNRQPLMYSWASHGDVANYISDADAAQRTENNLAEFIKVVLDHTKKGKVHLIAHSMGTRALTSVLANLDYYHIDKSKIGEVILLAADIDTVVFEDNLLPRMKKYDLSITSYASTKDKALQLSQGLRNGLPRLGQAGENLTPLDGVTTIDAECSIDCGFCHNLTSLPCVLNDLTLLISRRLGPDKRLLVKRQKGNKIYYETLSAQSD